MKTKTDHMANQVIESNGGNVKKIKKEPIKRLDLSTFPPITKQVDEGIELEIVKEFEEYNKREGKRYPLSPSGIGKCGLKLARDVAHYHGLADYRRLEGSRTAKLQRIFSRGHLLESALIGDIEKYTDLRIDLRQQRVHLFDVVYDSNPKSSHSVPMVTAIEGDIDGLAVCKKSGFKILTDFKSKGAYYSAGFNDSIGEFFGNMLETGLVEDIGSNCYLIKDVNALFNVLPMDDFFVDYLLQLNSYAFSDWFRRIGLDGVALYYENKNTCANYEVRWKPDERLFEYAKNKFQYIYSTVMSKGAEAVPREFVQGSTRCKLCDYNDLCNGKSEYKGQPRISGVLPSKLETSYRETVLTQRKLEKTEGEILLEMERKGLTHIETSDGLVYEKKFLKSPKPHFELRLVK